MKPNAFIQTTSAVKREHMELTLRVMRAGDLPAVDALLRQAYRNQNDYVPRLRRQLALEPEGWLVAERDGALAGCGGVTVMGAAGYVGLVGVDPARQRQGIGGAVMRALIGWARERGCASILLDASDAGKPLYLGMGFVIEDQVTIWRRGEGAPRPPVFLPDVAIHAFQASDLAPLIAFDTAGYGAPRDCAVATYIGDEPELVSLTRAESGAITGYLAIQPDVRIAGPWLATSADAARALLLNALARHPAAIESAMAPDANADATSILRDAAFTPIRSLAHMRLGAPLGPSRRQTVYGQISLALG